MHLTSAKTSCAAITFGIVAVLMVAGAQAAHSQETVLYSFCNQANCADGAFPDAPVVLDKKGNLYGTTGAGGLYCGFDCGGYGTVFEVSPSGAETTIYSFGEQNGYADGGAPLDGLVMDRLGNLYGTTPAFGGASSNGNVFKLVPGEPWTEVVLYDFCSQPNCTDGSYTFAGVILDGKGNLYGTTPYGGSYNCGTVYKIAPSGNETVLYSFQCNNLRSGQNPWAGLLMARGGFYGTAQFGGAYGQGTVFKLNKKGKLTVIHSFNPANGDAGEPFTGNLIIDKEGNLYGATSYGGAYSRGAIYKVTPTGTETVLYSFCGQPNCADGSSPSGPLIMDKEGYLYGTTGIAGGGQGGYGTVFRLNPNPGGTETVLYQFCQADGCPDGAFANGGLVLDEKGNLYGTTGSGGLGGYGPGDGTVFKVVPYATGIGSEMWENTPAGGPDF